MPIEAMIGTTAAMGGVASLVTGENFWQGAINGFTIGALNHSLHGMRLAGAKLGAVAGLSCGGIGTVPGSIIGGAAGGIFGAWGGSSFSETIIDRMYNIW